MKRILRTTALPVIVVLLLAASPTQASLGSYMGGASDRAGYEDWFASLSGEYKAGVEYWAGHRGNPKEAFCNGARASEWMDGCLTAQQRFISLDAKRKADPEYRLGWNSVSASIQPAKAATPDPSTTALAGCYAITTATARLDCYDKMAGTSSSTRAEKPVLVPAYAETTRTPQEEAERMFGTLRLLEASGIAVHCHQRDEAWVHPITIVGGQDMLIEMRHIAAKFYGDARVNELIDEVQFRLQAATKAPTPEVCANLLRYPEILRQLDQKRSEALERQVENNLH